MREVGSTTQRNSTLFSKIQHSDATIIGARDIFYVGNSVHDYYK